MNLSPIRGAAIVGALGISLFGSCDALSQVRSLPSGAARTVAPPPAAVSSQAAILMNLFFKKEDNQTLMTVFPEEVYRVRNTLQAEWELRGDMAWVFAKPAPGLVALHRYSQTKIVDWLFTTNVEEGNLAVKVLGYVDENICCYVLSGPIPGKTTPIIRMVLGNHHVFTFSDGYAKYYERIGYSTEGIIGYAMKRTNDTPPVWPAQ